MFYIWCHFLLMGEMPRLANRFCSIINYWTNQCLYCSMKLSSSEYGQNIWKWVKIWYRWFLQRWDKTRNIKEDLFCHKFSLKFDGKLVYDMYQSLISVMVQGVKVTPITRTNVKVTWDALNDSDFSGDAATGGYIVEYRWVKRNEEKLGFKTEF